jgi:hypothetical protein
MSKLADLRKSTPSATENSGYFEMALVTVRRQGNPTNMDLGCSVAKRDTLAALTP